MTDILKRKWDVIIVGTGMGGGTLGRALAEKGWSVLFLEKGRSGFRGEQQGLNPSITEPSARLVRGAWPDKVSGTLNGRDHAFFAALGCGVGGSSVFYAGTLERPEPRDLDHSAEAPHPTGGWPFSWQEFSPWLEAAEAMYGVHRESGIASSEHVQSKSLKAVSLEDAAIMQRLRSNQCHPYILGSAVLATEGCMSCLGTKCPRHCKMDARSAGIEPALATGNCHLLDQCEVLSVRGNENRVSHVEAMYKGQQIQLQAGCFVLAAGALNSPRILLASRSTVWPQGCGNAHDLVGRNLMFHLDEMFVVWPPSKQRSNAPSKSVGLRDFYTVQGRRLGMIQAMGLNANYGEIVHFLKEWMLSRGWSSLAQAAPFVGLAVSRLLGQAKLFTGLLEDVPYPHNRVFLDPSHPETIRFEYTIMPELTARRKLYRKLIRRAFKGMRPFFITMDPLLNYGHPCGTVRAGVHPRSSVLNADCRVHDIENLYVVDASFFPTSMGVNPSLTIAANALRVADRMRKAA